jgi:hypothetical protein
VNVQLQEIEFLSGNVDKWASKLQNLGSFCERAVSVCQTMIEAVEAAEAGQCIDLCPVPFFE